MSVQSLARTWSGIQNPPAVVCHADWSLHADKQRCAVAVLGADGRYRAGPAHSAAPAGQLLAGLATTARGGAVLAAFDRTIGLRKLSTPTCSGTKRLLLKSGTDRPSAPADSPATPSTGSARGKGGSVKIRCPRCRWSPRHDDRWGCHCGHSWNTFTTRGLCPACRTQWTITQCQSCHAFSPHEDWYELEPPGP